MKKRARGVSARVTPTSSVPATPAVHKGGGHHVSQHNAAYAGARCQVFLVHHLHRLFHIIIYSFSHV